MFLIIFHWKWQNSGLGENKVFIKKSDTGVSFMGDTVIEYF